MPFDTIIRGTPVYNPYDLGSRMKNLRATMGSSVWEWFVPIRFRPADATDNEFSGLVWARQGRHIDDRLLPDVPGDGRGRRYGAV